MLDFICHWIAQSKIGSMFELPIVTVYNPTSSTRLVAAIFAPGRRLIPSAHALGTRRALELLILMKVAVGVFIVSINLYTFCDTLSEIMT